jgi:hypothetical protein
MFRSNHSIHHTSVLSQMMGGTQQQSYRSSIRQKYRIHPNLNVKNSSPPTRKCKLYDRRPEELTLGDYYVTMKQHENKQNGLRVYNPRIQHTEEIVNVFKFYFKEGYKALEQRKQTCHLAISYFTQTIMRCPNLKKNEIGVIATASLMCASKFDEVDYFLPPVSLLHQLMNYSAYISHYGKNGSYDSFEFTEDDIIV